MAVREFQGLIEWCAGDGAASRRRRVLGTLVYHYVGRELRGAWNGALTYAGGDGVEARFEGALHAIAPSAADEQLAVSVTVDSEHALVGLRGGGVDPSWAGGTPLVDVHTSNGMLEGRLSGEQDERFAWFAQPLLARRSS